MRRQVDDLVRNRVEANLRAIANTSLVDLPADKSFTYEEFVQAQAKFQAAQVCW
jgi:dynein heavy chain, axonemal